jgi:hypothetical protein
MRARLACVLVPWLIGCGNVVKPDDGVHITPHEPTTLDELVAMTSASGATFTWTKNGVARADVSGDHVDPAVTARGEVWGVDMTINGKVAGHDEVTIVNSAPAMPVVSLDSMMPVPGRKLVCLMPTPPTDPDDDTVTTTFSWTKNGTPYTSTTTTNVTGDSVAAIDIADGDIFQCTVKASDGMAESTASALSSAAACAHGTQMFSVNGTTPNGTLQTFTVPAGVCTMTIEAAGSIGGPVGSSGAGATNGATMIGTFALPAATVLTILVGSRPSTTGSQLGGGGGTFVVNAGQPLIVAGGGGSNFAGSIPLAEVQGRILTSGGTIGAAARSDNGAGGQIVAGSNSGGGGGFNSNGAGATGGRSYVAGGMGGGNATENQYGGYGGGGGRNGLFGEGGGGGYSGGSCGDVFTAPSSGAWVGCGGGGSFNSGANQVNTPGTNASDGYVKLTW